MSELEVKEEKRPETTKHPVRESSHDRDQQLIISADGQMREEKPGGVSDAYHDFVKERSGEFRSSSRQKIDEMKARDSGEVHKALKRAEAKNR